MPRIRKSALSGPASGLMEPRGELGFIQPRSSFSYQLPQLPQDVKLVWFASNKQSICLMYKYEQHTASLLWYNGPRRFMPCLLAETTAAFKAACLRHG